MLSEPVPIPPPLPPPVRTDACLEIEPDEQWKDDLRKRIEHNHRNMVEDAQIVRDTILNSQPSESSRERALQDYENSMEAIRKLAQEEFQLRLEMSERKWALNVIDSNSPDVARQQQWILDNIQQAQDERISNVSDDPSHNTAGAFSSNPQQQGDGEGGSDESLEDGSEGFVDVGSDDEGRASDESRESEEKDDDEDERGEEGSKPRQSHPPDRPDHPLTQSLPSKSPVARRNAPSRQRLSSNNQPAENNEEEDADDSYGHPPYWDGSQPYVTGAAPRRPSSGSRASSWRPHPHPPELSGISRTLAHANGQIYTSPVPFPRRGSVNSTGSTSRGAGLHRAGSLTFDQLRGSSVAPHTPSTAEHPPTQSRDRIAANIPPRERQTSASASPHDRPCPPSYSIISPPAITSARPPPLDESMHFPPRTINGPQRLPEDIRQGIAIPRGPTSPDEGQRVASWGSSLHSRRAVSDFNTHRRQSSKGDSRLPLINGDYSDESDDVVGRLDDPQSMHSARSLRSVRSMRSVDFEQMVLWREVEALRKEEEATRKEEDANKKEEEACRLEEKAWQSLDDAARLRAKARQAEASAKMREAEAKRKEAEAKKREAEAQKWEAEAQRREEEARHRELEARRKEEQARRKEEAAQQREEEARRREEEFRQKEDDARKREEDARRREEDARQLEMVARQKEDDARRFEEEVRKKEREVRRKEEWFHHSEEQQRKAAEQIRQRGEQDRQQQQQLEEPRQRTKEEQEREFQRREALYYQRMVERERQNSIGASDSGTAHRPTPSAGSTSDRSSASAIFSFSTGSTGSSRPTLMASPHTTSSSLTSSPLPFSSTARPSPTISRLGAPGTSLHATKFDEAEWARRAEERARQQQEQFRREQERLESEQQAKSVKMLSREDLIRLFENHENKWRQLKDGDKDLGWNSFAWPVFKRPSEPEEMTTPAIGAYVLSRYAPGASSKNSKDRIKDHIKRWHPDKVEIRILPRVVEEEREKVKAGAEAVMRGLKELLDKNYDD